MSYDSEGNYITGSVSTGQPGYDPATGARLWAPNPGNLTYMELQAESLANQQSGKPGLTWETSSGMMPLFEPDGSPAMTLLGPNRVPLLQALKITNPDGQAVTGPDGKLYWKEGSQQVDAGFGGQAGETGLNAFMGRAVPAAIIGGAGMGLASAFAGAGAVGAESGFSALESAGEFGTNAFDFGGTFGTTPLTGGGGFGSSFASGVSELAKQFTTQFGISPTQALSLAQKVGGALSAPGGNMSISTTGTGSADGSTSLAGGISAITGLFDLFSKSPYSSGGITDKAAATADPLMGDRAGYAGMLKELMTNPDSFRLSPAAQTQMNLGTENLTRSDAAKGLLGSGNILADIMKFGEGVSSQDFWKQIDELSLLSGAKTGSPAAAGQIMGGQLTNRNNALSNVGGGLAALSPQVASILKSLGITDPSTYTAGNGGIAAGAGGYTAGTIAGDANLPGDLAPGSTLVGGFGEAAGASNLEDAFALA